MDLEKEVESDTGNAILVEGMNTGKKDAIVQVLSLRFRFDKDGAIYDLNNKKGLGEPVAYLRNGTPDNYRIEAIGGIEVWKNNYLSGIYDTIIYASQSQMKN